MKPGYRKLRDRGRNLGGFSYGNASVLPVLSCSMKSNPGLEFSIAKSPVNLNKTRDMIVPNLKGRCVYLVGMMGCGKTTVGKILAEELGYSFVDSDDVVEKTMAGVRVSDIFRVHGEAFFREKESEALLTLSQKRRMVVSTGGGAVARPVNWKYMNEGLTVWLDVPLDVLARRLTSGGIISRPLLTGGPASTFDKTYNRLSVLFRDRGWSYAKADARVSFNSIAARLGDTDASSLTPSVIAFEVLRQLDSVLRGEGWGDCHALG